jgi:hypothetical protein
MDGAAFTYDPRVAFPTVPPLSPALAALQTTWLRHSGRTRRAELMLDLSSELKHDICNSLRALHPFADEQQISLQWIEYAYGAELAAKVRVHLIRTGRMKDPRLSG